MNNSKPLTPAQHSYLLWIKQHIAAVGIPPTYRQIAVGMGRSVTSAFHMVEALAERGFIRVGRGPKSIQVVGRCPACGHEDEPQPPAVGG